MVRGWGGGRRPPQSRSQQPRMQRMEYSVSGGARRPHPLLHSLPPIRQVQPTQPLLTSRCQRPVRVTLEGMVDCDLSMQGVEKVKRRGDVWVPPSAGFGGRLGWSIGQCRRGAWQPPSLPCFILLSAIMQPPPSTPLPPPTSSTKVAAASKNLPLQHQKKTSAPAMQA